MLHCRDCKHVRPVGITHLCTHPLAKRIDVKIGDVTYEEAHKMRRTPIYIRIDNNLHPPIGVCGETGRYFERDMDWNKELNMFIVIIAVLYCVQACNMKCEILCEILERYMIQCDMRDTL